MKYGVPRFGLFTMLVALVIFGVSSARNAVTADTATVNATSITAAVSDSKDKNAIEPFRAVAGQNEQVLVKVPEGKLLVIEFVTGRAFTLGPNSIPIHILTGEPNSNSAIYYIAPSHAEPFVTGTIAFYTHTVQIYVPAGEELKVIFQGGAGTDFVLSVSGHFVDVR